MRLRIPAPRRLRVRLTLGYVGLMTLVLLVFVVGTSWVMYTQLTGQLSRYIVQDLETIEGLVRFDPDGRPSVRDDYHNHPESRFVLERYFEILAPDGRLLYRNERLGTGTLGGATFEGEGVGGYSERTGRLDDGTRVLLVSRHHVFDGRPAVMRLAYSLEPVWQRVNDWVIDTLLSFTWMLLLAGFAAYTLVGRALVPIDTLATRVAGMTPERLDERLTVSHLDSELAHLGGVFNGLLDRVQQAFERLRRFTADASHELRTPLAAIRSVGEVGLQQARTPEEHREVIGSMLEEVDRLTRLVDGLLELARSDGDAPLRRVPVAMLALAREAAGMLEVLAEEKEQRLSVGGDTTATVSGDPVFLRQAIVNIVHNAVKYTPSGGEIRVEVRAVPDGRVVVEVADSGVGIAPEHLPHIFDRFYRVDASRCRERGGFGLGLAIAHSAVAAHGGTIDVESPPQGGAVFRISLPPSAAQTSAVRTSAVERQAV